MATGQTKLSNLVNPQVMADIISAKLSSAIRVTPFAKIDTTLEGVAGNTITVPSFAYIGDAEDVAEGVAMGTTVLTASTATATVKKAGKAVEITDEAIASGYGDPVGSATTQLTKSIASKIDQDAMDALGTATLVYNGSTAIIGYDAVVNAVDLFEEEDQKPKVIFVHPKQVTQLRLDDDFKDINKYPITNGVIMTGTIGQIAGCQVVPSKKVKLASGVYQCPIVKLETEEETEDETPALTIYVKKGVEVESDRDILKKTTTVSADEHYTASLSNASKVVLAKFKSTPATP